MTYGESVESTTPDAGSPMTDESCLEAFVGKNADYYAGKWKSMQKSGSRVSFNWAAFFIGIFWLIYRKLYVQFFVVTLGVIIIATIISFLEEFGNVPTGVITFSDRLYPFVIAVIVGLFGNYWYQGKFRKYAKSARQHSSEPTERERWLRSKGGTNAIGAFLIFAAATILAVVGLILSNAVHVSKGVWNILGSLQLMYSIIFGVWIAIRSMSASRYKYVTIPLLSVVFIVGFIVSFGTLIERPVRHFWYSSVLDQYTNTVAMVSAMRALEPEEYNSFKSNTIAAAKRDRLDVSDVVSRANEEARQSIIPQALEYFSFASDSAVVKVAENHVALLESVSTRHPRNCENSKMGFNYNFPITHNRVRGLSAQFHSSLVEAVKSGTSMTPVAPVILNSVESAFGTFFTLYPEFRFMLNPSVRNPKNFSTGGGSLYCDARKKLLEYMLEQPKPVSAAFFRRYYR